MTNNPSEGYNNAFANGTLFISCHPPLYLWFGVVKKELAKVLQPTYLSIYIPFHLISFSFSGGTRSIPSKIW